LKKEDLSLTCAPQFFSYNPLPILLKEEGSIRQKHLEHRGKNVWSIDGSSSASAALPTAPLLLTIFKEREQMEVIAALLQK